MRRLIPFALVALLSACSTPPPVPDDHYYRLPDLTPDGSGQRALLEGGLLVSLPVANGVRRARKILYSDDPHHLRFQQYHYHQWEASIPQVVQRRLAGLAAQRGWAGEVLTRPGSGVGHRLDSRILRFERLVSGDRYTAMVDIEFQLSPNDAARTPIATGHYPIEVTARGARMEDTVMAFAEAVDEAFDRFQADLERNLDQ